MSGECIADLAIGFSIVAIAVSPARSVVAVSCVVIRALPVVARTASERPCIIMAFAHARLGLAPVVIAIMIAGAALVSTTPRVGMPLVVSRIEVSRIEIHDHAGVAALRPRRSCRYIMDNPWTIGSGRGWIGVASGMQKSQENREQRFPAAPGCLIPTAF
jgi:hypothetical protein